MAVVKIKNANGNWQNVVALKGDKGDTGERGPVGPAGTTSFSGLTDVPDRVKNAVSSVNGESADASGNVAISVPTGALSQKHSTSKTTVASNGSKTITISRLTAYKPVYFMAWQDPSTSTEYGQSLGIKIASGIVNAVDGFGASGSASTTSAADGFYFAAWNKTQNKGVLAVSVVIPTGTSVAINFSNGYSKTVTFSVKAWQ